MMTKDKNVLTGSLEDYLETVYELVRDRKFARVKDIARARGVQAGSVSPAMRRLADLGMVQYVQREYIDLTPLGEEHARRILARHRLLTRFFMEILGVSPATAEADACAMEHSLSAESMDHLTRFFEFLQVCPDGRKFLESFHSCPRIQPASEECTLHHRNGHDVVAEQGGQVVSVADLKPGEKGRVTQVAGTGPIRRRLLDMGILPDTTVELERVAPTGDPLWIKFQGTQLSLRRKEAGLVSVVPYQEV